MALSQQSLFILDLERALTAQGLEQVRKPDERTTATS